MLIKSRNENIYQLEGFKVEFPYRVFNDVSHALSCTDLTVLGLSTLVLIATKNKKVQIHRRTEKKRRKAKKVN